MTLPGLLLRLFTSHKPDQLAGHVANRSRLAAWDRVSHRLHTLGGAEARGYIRSRTTCVIELETDRLIAEAGVKVLRHRDQIVKDASELVIPLVLEQAQINRRQVQPKRRAA